MRVGDLYRIDNQLWLIASYNPNVRAGQAISPTHERMTILDEPDLKPFAHPLSEWYVLLGSVQKKAGPYTQVQIPASNVTLKPHEQWVQVIPDLDGGSILVNPKVTLHYGTVLLAQHGNGTGARFTVPLKCRTLPQTQAETQRGIPKIVTKSRFDRFRDSEDK